MEELKKMKFYFSEKNLPTDSFRKAWATEINDLIEEYPNRCFSLYCSLLGFFEFYLRDSIKYDAFKKDKKLKDEFEYQAKFSKRLNQKDSIQELVKELQDRGYLKSITREEINYVDRFRTAFQHGNPGLLLDKNPENKEPAGVMLDIETGERKVLKDLPRGAFIINSIFLAKIKQDNEPLIILLSVMNKIIKDLEEDLRPKS